MPSMSIEAGPPEAGHIGWDRLDNALYGVGSVALIGQGTPGERALDSLTGGADLDPSVAPQNAAAFWYYS